MTETTLFFKKAWIWLKTHWYLPLLLVALVCVWWSGRARTERILKMFDASKESYKKQIDVLNKSHEEELRKRLGEYYKIHHLNIPFYRYRMHNTNKTKSKGYTQTKV